MGKGRSSRAQTRSATDRGYLPGIVTMKNETPIITDLCTAEQEAALTHLRDLLQTHFRAAEDAADENGKFAIGFRVTFDRSGSPRKVKVACRISKTFTDEIE